jgi:hypothetical protein
MRTLNIATGNLVKFTNRLEKLSKSDLPRVVKKTLDETAMDVKSRTMPKSAKDNFTIRRANFFKANSRVQFATFSSDLSKISSTVGFVPLKGQNKAVEDLEAQEHGGKIKRSFVAMDTARAGNSNAKQVQAKNRLGNVKNPVHAAKGKGKSAGSRMIRAVNKAGVGGHVLSEKGIVWRVNSIRRGGLKMTPIYSYKKGRQVQIKGTDFMRDASLDSTKTMDDKFIKNAQKQIDYRLSK